MKIASFWMTLCLAALVHLFVPAQTNVTFQVDMSQQSVNPVGVSIAGSFQGWTPGATPLTDQGNGIWSVVVAIPEGTEIQYKFINGNSWGQDESVPFECQSGGNRFFTVPATDVTLPAVCFGSCAVCPNPVDVTFQVDMSNETVSPNGVHVAGSFNGFSTTATPLTDQGNGVYAATVTLTNGEFITYKYLNGTDFAFAESVPAACGQNDGFGGNNRFLSVSSAATVLDLHCFGTCVACIPPAVGGCTNANAVNFDASATQDDGSCLYTVTFQVDLSNETVSLDGVHVAGSFNGFSSTATPLVDQGNGVWAVTVDIPAGNIQYKYLNGNDFAFAESVPAACGQDDGFGGNNRVYEVLTQTQTIDLHCFGECGVCPPPIVAVTFFVNTEFITVAPEDIHIAGSFQGYNSSSTPMVELAQDLWVYTGFFTPGEEISYKFINGNTWGNDENVPSACGVVNGFGGFNRTLTIPAENTDLPIVCFGFCENCDQVVIDGCTNAAASNFDPLANNDNGSCVYPVTFLVNMGNIDVSPVGIYIGANFQGFVSNGTPMVDAGNGLWSYTLSLPAGYVAEYKFINGDDWSQAESVPLACGDPDGFNGAQRVYTVGAGQNTVPVVCFSSCEDCQDCTGELGCTYPGAANFSATAVIDDGSCLFEGCTDPLAINFSPQNNVSTPTCVYGQDFCGEGSVWNPDTGACEGQLDCAGDLNFDGLVNATDLSVFLSNFGTLCQ